MDSSSLPESASESTGAPGTESLRPEGDRRRSADVRGPDHCVPDARFARLLDRTMQPFAMIDLQGRFMRVNPAFEKLTGYSAAELLTMTLEDLTPVRWQSTIADVLVRVRSDGRPIRYEKEYRRKDGRLVPVEAAVDLDLDEHDAPAGFFAFVTDLSERKQFEAALRDSEERYRRLYDDAPIGYHEVDAEGRLVSVNQTECEMLGYSRQEVLGRSLFDFLSEESRDETQRRFRETVEGKRPVSTLEYTFVRRDGTRLIAAVREIHDRDPEGGVIGVRGTVLDISDRKRAEAALVESERRARAFFDGIDEAVFVHSPEGRILDANPAASRLLGYSRTELLALSTRDIDDPEFAAGYEDRLRKQLAEGRLSCEGRHRTKFGRAVPVEIHTSTIQFDDERAVLAVVRDISERKVLEETRERFAEAQERNAREMEAKNQALTQSEARYRQLTECAVDGVVVADGEGRITLFNPAAEKIFDCKADEILGQPLSRLMPLDLRAAHDHGFARYVRDRVPHIVGKTFEIRGLRKNGEEFPLELSLSVVESAGKLQFIGSVRDQTERQRMRDMLLQSEKLASIGLLSAGVAHEINNPLAYVANNLAVLERDMRGIQELIGLYESTEDALACSCAGTLEKIRALSDDFDWPYVRENLGRMLARTREGVQRVANIVHSLRSLARTSVPKMEMARIGEVIDSALEVIRGRLKRHRIELVVENADVPPIACIPSQVGQVILNLLINASQAIEAEPPAEGGLIRLRCYSEDNSVVLSVSDNGCGISTENLPKLFDPFFTTKPVGEGTGLGLAISHGIISGHGGRIDVESRPGAGSCFRVYLPLNPS